MAMSDTTSDHTDWLQFYQHNLTVGTRSPASSLYGQVSSMAESTVVTTTSVSPSTVTGTTTTATAGAHSNIQRRIGKSVRRRSRASRKAPTTLLNTDTTNFRAMVQQFTGIPSVPFHSSAYQAGGTPAFNIQLGGNQLRQPMAGFSFHHQNQQQDQQQQQQQNQYYHPQYQQQQEQTIFTLGNNNGCSDAYLQGFNNTRTSQEASDGLVSNGEHLSAGDDLKARLH